MLVFAHPSLALLRVLEKQEFYGWGKSLKILVSVVRFRPRPPRSNAQLFPVGRFGLRHPPTLAVGENAVWNGSVQGMFVSGRFPAPLSLQYRLNAPLMPVMKKS